MANYVLNKIICTEEILNKYFIDYYPIDENEKLEEPYISFNKLFGVKSLNYYAEKYGEYIYYGYGFSYEKNKEGLIEIKFLTRYLYPICAIVKAVEMFKEELVWYSCEENKIYLSKFFWDGKKVQESTLYLENTEHDEWINNNEDNIEKIEYPDNEIWHYNYESRKDWKIWESDNLIKRYFDKYSSEEYYNQMCFNIKSKEKNKKIIFYNLNGTIKREEILIKENLAHINGMMTKCYMVDGKEQIGYADSEGTFDKEKNDKSIHDDIYLWTWDNLDEETGKLIGNDDEKYNQTFKKVRIDKIEKVEAILYSNPRWGGKLTNKFEFYSNDINKKIDIPDFIKKNNKDEDDSTEIEKDESYYFLTVKYEDYTGDKEYNYISEDTTIGVGDRVLVDRAGNLAVAIVLETGYFNKFDSPFPVNKTKRIIKKVDYDFMLEDIEFNDEIMPKNILKIKVTDTNFSFGILGYISGEGNDDDWTTIIINVHNAYFNYSRNAELMTSAEIEILLKELEKLLEDKFNEKNEIKFYEPDLEIDLYPKINLWDTGKYSYIKEGHEIQDIYMELNINLTDKEGTYTGEKYVMIFDREEIKKIVEYIKKVINSA